MLVRNLGTALGVVGSLLMASSHVGLAQSIREQAIARADSAIQLRKSLTLDARIAGSAGVLVAEGDSWFAYPGTNLIKELERLGYRVESNAQNGSHLEEMAYSDKRLSDFYDKLTKANSNWKAKPKAILLSGGGNDIVNEPLALMLNHAEAHTSTLDTVIAHALIDVRLGSAIKSWIYASQRMVETLYGPGTRIPVLMHGYDFATPDGRGYKKFFVTWTGPWMRPEFLQRGYEDTEQNKAVVHALIVRYNAMLDRLEADTTLHLKHVRLAGLLSDKPEDYRQWWDNELHPEVKGFRTLAQEYAKAIQASR